MFDLVDNRTDLPTPSWITGPGTYIDALGEFWQETVIELVRERGGNLPDDLRLGFLLDVEEPCCRIGNTFLVNPAVIGGRGLSGSMLNRKPTPPSFKKRWRMDRDKAEIKNLAKRLVMEDGFYQDN